MHERNEKLKSNNAIRYEMSVRVSPEKAVNFNYRGIRSQSINQNNLSNKALQNQGTGVMPLLNNGNPNVRITINPRRGSQGNQPQGGYQGPGAKQKQ